MSLFILRHLNLLSRKFYFSNCVIVAANKRYVLAINKLRLLYKYKSYISLEYTRDNVFLQL